MATKSRRGFAAMDVEKQREIARKGGRAAHAKGTAHEFTSDEAREAGRRGGQAVSRDRSHMAEIGRRGGLNSHGGRGRDLQKSDSAEAGATPTTSRRGRKTDEGNQPKGRGRRISAAAREKMSEGGRKGGEHSHNGHATHKGE
jgi:general stress protein YciG